MNVLHVKVYCATPTSNNSNLAHGMYSIVSLGYKPNINEGLRKYHSKLCMEMRTILKVRNWPN